MNELVPNFFQAGGALKKNHPSYIARVADQQLVAALQRGEYCYILTARQIGKTSLMFQTATYLREAAEFTTVTLDLSVLGSENAIMEEWYAGMFDQLGRLRIANRTLNLRNQLEHYFRHQLDSTMTPFHRWRRTIREVLLPNCVGRLVIFVDEVDSIFSLPFSVNEFFAIIRSFYNDPDDPEFSRLTFCLLGVASPSDLIRDAKTTPFNIAQRIELRDFTEAEALLLAQGLLGVSENRLAAEALVRRVLYWTGGHPYLTQRLCTQLVEPVAPLTEELVSTKITVKDVDRAVKAIFFTPLALETDDNLSFVRNRLLSRDVDVAAVMELYGRILRGKRVRNIGRSSTTDLLRLAGIITSDSAGLLRPRNRIYQTVFDRNWIQANLPDAELQRQRRAFRQGLLRASAIGSVAVGVISVLLAMTVSARNESDQTAFLANMGLASRVYEEGNIRRALQLVESYPPGHPYRQRNEWRLLWQLCQDTQGHWSGLPKQPLGLFAKSDGTITVIGRDGTLQTRQARDGTLLATCNLLAPGEILHQVAFTPDGAHVALGLGRGEIVLHDLRKPQVLWRKQYHDNNGLSWRLAFSPKGDWLASGDYNGSVHLIRPTTGEQLRVEKVGEDPVVALSFSPEGNSLATGDTRGKVALVALATSKVTTLRTGKTSHVRALCFSPDGRKLLVGFQDEGTLVIEPGKPSASRLLPPAHTKGCQGIEFSADGKQFVTAGFDQVAVLWDAQQEIPLRVFRGHTATLWWARFLAPQQLLTLDSTGGVRLWEVPESAPTTSLDVLGLATAPDSRHVAVATMPDATIHLYETRRGTELVSYPAGHTLPDGKPGIPFALAYSADGKTLASVGSDGFVRLWAMPGHRLFLALGKPPIASSEWLMRVALTPDARFVATRTQSGRVQLWSTADRRELWRTEGGSQGALAFSPDGSRLVCAHKESGKLMILATRSGSPVTRPIALGRGIGELDFSNEGERVGVALDDQSVVVYNLRTEKIEERFFGHTGGVTQLVFSPDGKNLVTGGKDGSLKFWDLATGRETITLSDTENAISGLRFSPDGEVLSITDETRRTRQFYLPTTPGSTRSRERT